MSNESNIAVSFIIVVCINYTVNIFLCLCNIFIFKIVKVNKVKCVVDFTVQKAAVILVEELAFCNIQKKLKVIHKVKNRVVYCCKIGTLKNLTAAPY